MYDDVEAAMEDFVPLNKQQKKVKECLIKQFKIFQEKIFESEVDSEYVEKYLEKQNVN